VTASQPVVLFVCVRNAGRSQIAEAIFNRDVEGRAVARSAGSDPGETVHPEVVQVLGEVGLDVSGSKPRGLGPEVLDGVDVVVAMGCGDACPMIPGAKVVEWDIADPAGKPLPVVRSIRDEIARLVGDLIRDLSGRVLKPAPW
jgi:arsenate reductase (thioredoxin)